MCKGWSTLVKSNPVFGLQFVLYRWDDDDDDGDDDHDDDDDDDDSDGEDGDDDDDQFLLYRWDDINNQYTLVLAAIWKYICVDMIDI